MDSVHVAGYLVIGENDEIPERDAEPRERTTHSAGRLKAMFFPITCRALSTLLVGFNPNVETDSAHRDRNVCSASAVAPPKP